jgi:hypothetical protein
VRYALLSVSDERDGSALGAVMLPRAELSRLKSLQSIIGKRLWVGGGSGECGERRGSKPSVLCKRKSQGSVATLRDYVIIFASESDVGRRPILDSSCGHWGEREP